MIPETFQQWLDKKGWRLRPYQEKMLAAYHTYQNILLTAPPGAGKTFAVFLPIYLSLLQKTQFKGMHTLYISPLRSLTYDIARSIRGPIEEINLPIDVGIRTGDTSPYERQKQNKKPPNIFLITPESLALMLSYSQLLDKFKTLEVIVIDEIHTFVSTKRGDHLSLLLAQLSKLAPAAKRIGLSATIKDPEAVARWLGCPQKSHTIREKEKVNPNVKILYPSKPLPLAGYYAIAPVVKSIYEVILKYSTNIIFVNTRAQAESLLQSLWSINNHNLPITIHHGSLSKEQRLKVEQAMAEGALRAIVATSSLELGIDWGNVDMVINVGAPKGISRLLQRIGRSNHNLERPSEALLVPLNRFEALECEAALKAIELKMLDDEPPHLKGSIDILAQHIMSCACAQPINPKELFFQIKNAYPYQHMKMETFKSIFDFVVNGGYVLKHYTNFHKLIANDKNFFTPASNQVQKIHRLNMGTIIENEKLKVMLVTGKNSGKRKKGKGTFLGKIAEKFILNLKPGDTFFFAGHTLCFREVNGLAAEVSVAKVNQVKVPAFVGSSMPLSTNLSQLLRETIENSAENSNLPDYVHAWLETQKKISSLPKKQELLVELFPHDGLHYLTIYTLEGRPINQTLGFLLSYRLEQAGVNPLGFTVSDYGLSIRCIYPLSPGCLDNLWNIDLCMESYNRWLQESSMLKRYFRNTATVSGLIYSKYPGHAKKGKQVLFSTDLIYDVLKKYEPNHILLQGNQVEAEKNLVDMKRLIDFLSTYQRKIHYQLCKSITPFAIHIVVQSLSESLNNPAKDALLEMHFLQKQAEKLYKKIDGL
ncbi:ligase-associated DNA damage response DEXH box helicase [Candidatus Paracaedibacter symbiosus]|uniref:ligase-associated DNA damage response DEXH box helicase n=1 Tax=Candidatus Paracaedibacter symbiosus TaxID=244582 RepID=UPI000509ABF8|nr:ligase-associated DNA damage response DEXH box helicase [Candidatus Paracaedibacter symbiosus]